MMRATALALLGLAACQGDETLSGFVPDGSTWQLVALDGAPWTERATLSFPEEGRVAGQAPCNRYFAAQKVPYPWFELTAIGATKMFCPNLEAEQTFFEALTHMSLAEVSGDVLILSNDAGRQMQFERQSP